MLSIGRVICLWRTERKLTQEDLARLSGVARPNLCLIERGARDLTLVTLRRLAQALRIPPGTLADGIPPVRFHPRWSRENLDRMAGYLAGKHPILSNRERQAANAIRPLISQKIRLGKGLSQGDSFRRHARKESRSLMAAKCEFDDAEIKSLLARLDKSRDGSAPLRRHQPAQIPSLGQGKAEKLAGKPAGHPPLWNQRERHQAR